MSWKDSLEKLVENMKKADPERLARLEAMGADTSQVMFHGTNEIKREPVFQTEPPWTEFKQQEKPTFLTPNPTLSELFSGADYSSSSPFIQQRTLPVFAPKGNYFDWQNPEHIKNLELNIYANAPKIGLPQTEEHLRALRALSSPEVKDNWIFLQNLKEPIQQAGHTGYYEQERGIKNLAVFDPTKIKSVWAKGKGTGLIGGTAAATMLSVPSESQAYEEAANPLKTFGKLVNQYRKAQEGAADYITEKANITGQPVTERTKEAGRMLFDPLNFIEGPLGHALMGIELMSDKKEK